MTGPDPIGSDRFSVVEFTDELAGEFRDINEAWISSLFGLEPDDHRVLYNPRREILDTGGAIIFVHDSECGIVGTCALQNTGPGQFELFKMGVKDIARGRKAGEFLVRAAIERALRMGATRLYLRTNHKLSAAIHLYRKLGFIDDAAVMAEFGAQYKRIDVAMLYSPGT